MAKRNTEGDCDYKCVEHYGLRWADSVTQWVQFVLRPPGGDASLASAYLRVVSCYCLSRILILWSVPSTPKRMGTSIKSYIPKQQITTCNLWPKQVNLLNPPWIALIWIAADASSARQIGFYVGTYLYLVSTTLCIYLCLSLSSTYNTGFACLRTRPIGVCPVWYLFMYYYFCTYSNVLSPSNVKYLPTQQVTWSMPASPS